MKHIWGLLVLLPLFLVSTALAAMDAPDMHGRHLMDSYDAKTWHGKPVGVTKAVADTIYLLGGPDREDGDFQHESVPSFPQDEGWFGVDMTERTEAVWHISTYNAALLDTLQLPNRAMWCGEDWPSCGPGEPVGGYGNGYLEYLDWYGIVPNSSGSTQVTLTARLNFDNEPGYDLLTLEVERSSGMEVVQTWNGDNRVEGEFVPVDVSETFSVLPVDYVGPDGDQIHLRWQFQSDTGWSDEDCYWPTEGAAQVDNIVVNFDEVPWTIDDFEPGNWVNWQVAFPPGVGNYAWTWPQIHSADPCRLNLTSQWAFIDDGLVQPGTGGYLCTTWCYGPGGYIVNPEGGLAGPDFHIRNEVWSPEIAWPGSGYDGAIFAFGVYRHETLSSTAPGVFYNWHIRSTSDPTGDNNWSGWFDRNFSFYGGPDYIRHHEFVTDLLVSGRQYVQLSLGVEELGWVWGWEGVDGTPAPYFDNVAFLAFEFAGPAMSAREIDLAQDNFPAIGTIDYSNLDANSIRFDMAANIALPAELFNDPGDSIIVDVAAVRTGSELNDRPLLCYKLNPNPLFDAVRSSGLPLEGCVYGDTTYSASGTILADRWNFDLPDTGFFFPGDVLHYYIFAQDEIGGDIGTSIMPGDTTGFSFFPGDSGYVPLRYPGPFIVHGLPSLVSLSEGDCPPILIWNDFGRRGGENEWSFALGNLGYLQGIDYDLYTTSGPSSGVGNGLGGRATANQLLGYQTLLYTCGDLSVFTISNGDFENDGGDDVGVLDTWLRYGAKNVLFTGDNLVFDLQQSGTQTLGFLSNWFSVNFVAQDLRPLVNNQAAPLVRAINGNPVFIGVEEWTAHGGCPSIKTIDAVTEAGTAQRLAEFIDPYGSAGIYPYAAAVLYHEANFEDDIIVLPYDFIDIYTPYTHIPPDTTKMTPASAPTRALVLEQILLYFGHQGSSSVITNTPAREIFQVRNFPNPFNPSTKIAYQMPQRGWLTIKVFNVRGELVRTLKDGVVPAGPGAVVWDGTDNRGASSSSGVYFLESEALGQRSVQKTALIK